jgi:hypothetical protein
MDIFISTWEGSGFTKNHSFAYLHIQDELPKTDAEFNNVDPKIDQDEIRKMFNPKAMIVDSPDNPTINDIRSKFIGRLDGCRVQVESVALMYYRIFDCNNLKKKYEAENNMKYDIVIRSRFDLAMTHLNLDEDMNGAHVKIRRHVVDGMNDTMWFANSDIMDKICDLYTMLDVDYLSGNYNADKLLKNRIDSQSIPYHHCMNFGYIFVKPPHAIDYDSGTYIAPYDDFV